MSSLTEMQRYYFKEKNVLTYPWNSFDSRRNGNLVWKDAGFPPELLRQEIEKRNREKYYLKRVFDVEIPIPTPETKIALQVSRVEKLYLKKKMVIIYGRTLPVQKLVTMALMTHYLTTGETIVMTDTEEFIQMYKRISSEFDMDDEFMLYRQKLYENILLWRGLDRKVPYANSHSGLFSEVIEHRIGTGMLCTVSYNENRQSRKIKKLWKDAILERIAVSMGQGIADLIEVEGVFVPADASKQTVSPWGGINEVVLEKKDSLIERPNDKC